MTFPPAPPGVDTHLHNWALAHRSATSTALARDVTRGGSSMLVLPMVLAAALTFALTVGWSRVWLGVHWPADVLGGWLFAGACLAAARVAQLQLFPATGFATSRTPPQASGAR